jgi:manganese/zinc/iron transport system permease protein
LTVVTAFDAVGSVLVVAFMVVPASSAYLLTDRLNIMLILSALLGAAGAFAGTWLAFVFHTTIAGTVASVLGLEFALVFTFAPHRGLLPQLRRRIRQRHEFFETMLVIHLLQHEGTPEEEEESRLDRLHKHLRWKPIEVERVMRRAARNGWIELADKRLRLIEAGRAVAQAQLEKIPSPVLSRGGIAN